MTAEWRLLLTGYRSAAENMAVDEAVLRHVVEGDAPPTVRFYGWDPSAVSIGYFQGIEQEVDLEVCQEQGVAVVRRLTGGGAVYHDREGEITYSLMVSEDSPGIPRKITDSYELLCRALVLGFEQLGLPARFHPINDILVNGKKISGNAQTRRFGGVLQHGTLLCTVDPQRMFSLLKVPSEKIRDKLIQGVEERVTSIQRELGEVDTDTVTQAMIAGFETVLDVRLVEGTLSATELNQAAQLREERYDNPTWNFKR
ncbi:MAG: lipoate--protein ligase family protein [Anaerolineae bacterium]